jgi:hypothetical protein
MIMAEGIMPRARIVVEHSNFLKPEDLYRFINLDGFNQDWEGLGLDDDDQYLLQVQIMLAPLKPPIIPGTGGIRRTQFSPPPHEGERRKNIEVLYAVFPDFSVAIMAAADRYDRMEELLPDQKTSLQTMLEEIQSALSRGM